MYENNFYLGIYLFLPSVVLYIYFFFQGSRVPTLKINLGPRIDTTTTTGSSNGGLSGSSKKHHHHHKHHRKHKKSKKKKHIDSDDDDDIVELSNGSDEDYRV